MKRILTLATLTALAASPALAHHPLAGAPMETFVHGMLSGIGHPVLGFDHMFFVALVGVAALFTGRALMAPAGYIAGMLAGCLAAMAGLGLPMVEVVIAASLVVLGGVVLSGRALGSTAAIALFAAFGLFHGQAFAGSIVGQEAGYGLSVALGYLIGLGVVQYAMSIAAGFVALRLFKATEATATSARLAGALVAGAGLLLTLEHAEGAVFAALGLA